MKKLSLSSIKNSDAVKFVVVFVLALVLRAVPELLSGKYPVGFDALSGYAPAISALPDNSPMKVFGWAYSPLAIYLLWSIRLATGVDNYLLLKIVGPILYGLFNVSFCYMLSHGLGWSKKKSVIVSLLFLMQPAIMRMGWDQLREELGLIFFFTLLAITKCNFISGARSKPLLFVVLSLLIVFSHQLAAILFFVVVFWQSANSAVKKNQDVKYAILIVLPAILIFTWQMYGQFVNVNFVDHFAPIQWSSNTGSFIFTNYLSSDPHFLGGDYRLVVSHIFFLSAYTVLPLIPFAIKGFFRSKVFTPMLAWLSIMGYSIVVYPWYAFSNYWWWILLLPIPLTVYLGEGLDRMKAFVNPKKLKITIAALGMLSLFAFGYASSTIKIGYPYAYYYIPSGLVESSVPLDDIPDVQSAFEWMNNNISENATVIVPEKLQGIALLNLRPDVKIRVAPPIINLNTLLNYAKIEDLAYAVYYESDILPSQNIMILTNFGKIQVCQITPE